MECYDIIIVGGGPAGLTCALYSARAGKKVLVLEKENVGGQIVYAPMVENYPGSMKLSGQEFANSLLEQIEALDVDIQYEEVVSILPGKPHRVVTDMVEREALAVVIATGTSHRTLGVEGESELIGAGVSYCALCDGPFYKGKDIAIIGGGNTAAQEAIYLSEICNKVVLVHRRDKLRADDMLVKRLENIDNIEIIYKTNVDRILKKDGCVSGIRLNNNEVLSEVDVEAVFLAVGQKPNSEVYNELNISDSNGFVRAKETTITDIEGVFAAGDCRMKNVRQLTTACSDGAVAATVACEYIDSIRHSIIKKCIN